MVDLVCPIVAVLEVRSKLVLGEFGYERALSVRDW
jgi:hypothetical protein